MCSHPICNFRLLFHKFEEQRLPCAHILSVIFDEHSFACFKLLFPKFFNQRSFAFLKLNFWQEQRLPCVHFDQHSFACLKLLFHKFEEQRLACVHILSTIFDQHRFACHKLLFHKFEEQRLPCAYILSVIFDQRICLKLCSTNLKNKGYVFTSYLQFLTNTSYL